MTSLLIIFFTVFIFIFFSFYINISEIKIDKVIISNKNINIKERSDNIKYDNIFI